MAEAAAFCQNCGAKVGETKSKNERLTFDARLISKIGLLLVCLGFLMPVMRIFIVNVNGFSLAGWIFEKSYRLKAHGVWLYLFFLASLAGVGVGISLHMKKTVPIIVDWIILLVCIASGFLGISAAFTTYRELFGAEASIASLISALQSGFFLILIGLIAALVAQIRYGIVYLRENVQASDYPDGYVSKNSVKTYLLCLFFGGFAVHRFYVGKKRDGFFMLIPIIATMGISNLISRYAPFGNISIVALLPLLAWAALWLMDIAKMHNGTFTDKQGFPLSYPHDQEYPEGYTPKNKITALLLCIFLGGFAVHRFYVRGAKSGISLLITSPLALIVLAPIATAIALGTGSNSALTFLPVIGIVPIYTWLIRWALDLINICSDEFKDKEGYPLIKKTSTKNALCGGAA